MSLSCCTTVPFTLYIFSLISTHNFSFVPTEYYVSLFAIVFRSFSSRFINKVSFNANFSEIKEIIATVSIIHSIRIFIQFDNSFYNIIIIILICFWSSILINIFKIYFLLLTEFRIYITNLGCVLLFLLCKNFQENYWAYL